MDIAQHRIKECIENKDTGLDLSHLKLTELPNNLPESLTHLFCNHNNLTELPNNLHGSITDIWCRNNNLSRLPDNLPDSLIYLNCVNNKITELRPDILKIKYFYFDGDDKMDLIKKYCANHITRFYQMRKQINKTSYMSTLYNSGGGQLSKDLAGLLSEY